MATNDAAVLDLMAIARDLENAAVQAQTSVMQILVNMAEQIASYMRQEVPVRSGKLRDSIRVKVMDDRIEIGPEGADYGVYVHYGTKPHEIHAKKGGTLAFQVGNRTVFATVVHHPGTQPNPFAERAAKRFLDDIAGAVGDEGVRLITEGRHGNRA